MSIQMEESSEETVDAEAETKEREAEAQGRRDENFRNAMNQQKYVAAQQHTGNRTDNLHLAKLLTIITNPTYQSYEFALQYVRGSSREYDNIVFRELANIKIDHITEIVIHLGLIYDESRNIYDDYLTPGIQNRSAFLVLARKLATRIERDYTVFNVFLEIVQSYTNYMAIRLLLQYIVLKRPQAGTRYTMLHAIIDRDEPEQGVDVETERFQLLRAYITSSLQAQQSILDVMDSTPLIFAVRSKLSLMEIRVIAEAYNFSALHAKDIKKNTALAYAIKQGREDIVLHFADNYQNFNFSSKNQDGDTLLIMAVETGNTNIVVALYNNLARQRIADVDRKKIIALKGFRQLTAYEIVYQDWKLVEERLEILNRFNPQ